MSQLTDFE